MRSIEMRTLPLLLVLTTLTLSERQSLACMDVPARFRHINKRSTDDQPIAGDNNAIPMEFYNELDNITTISEYIERFADKDSNPAMLDPARRSVQRDNAIEPESARCTTESVTVPLIPYEQSNDPQVVYFPSCTRVKRCGGCCFPANAKACEPSESEYVNFKILKKRLNDAGFEYVIVPVEQHLKCRCVCRIKEKDCKPNQYYNPRDCRCECANYTEMNKCLEGKVSGKYWDSASCSCKCRDTQTCTTGTYFNEKLCQCIDPTESEFSSSSTIEDRRRFIVKAVPVEIEPDNSTLYST